MTFVQTYICVSVTTRIWADGGCTLRLENSPANVTRAAANCWYLIGWCGDTVFLYWLILKQLDQVTNTFHIELLLRGQCVFNQVDAPSYLSDACNSAPEASHCLRSSGTITCVIPWSRTRLGDRFDVAGPRLWNKLPASLQSSDSICQFRRQLKTFLFVKDYAVHLVTLAVWSWIQILLLTYLLT